MSENIVKVLQRSQLSHSQADVKPFIYMHSKWLEDSTELQLFLTTSNSCYKATLKHDEIKSAAEELEQPYDEFFAECKNALTTQMGLPGFDYELNEEDMQFKLWKCTGFETLYIEVSLRKVSTFHQLLDAAIECGQGQSTTAAAESSSQSELSSSQPNELAAEYEQYIKETKEQENELLEKFLLLLNSKKRRIEQLEKELKKRRKVAVYSDSDEADMQQEDVVGERRKVAGESDTNVEDVQQEDVQQEDVQQEDVQQETDDIDFGRATQALTQKE